MLTDPASFPIARGWLSSGEVSLNELGGRDVTPGHGLRCRTEDRNGKATYEDHDAVDKGGDPAIRGDPAVGDPGAGRLWK
jgi:hypothetical protein